MTLRLSVQSVDPSAEESWTTDLKIALRGVSDVAVERFPKDIAGVPGQVVFVDGSTEQALRSLGANLERFDRRGRAVFLIVREGTPMPQALIEGQVDDVLVHPFRALEAAHFGTLQDQFGSPGDLQHIAGGKFYEDKARPGVQLQIAQRIEMQIVGKIRNAQDLTVHPYKTRLATAM